MVIFLYVYTVSPHRMPVCGTACVGMPCGHCLSVVEAEDAFQSLPAACFSVIIAWQ